VAPLAVLVSAPGRGAVAVVHLAGDGARSLAARLLGRPVDRRARHGMLALDGRGLDEAVVREVDGFTGEETVEIDGHGGLPGVEQLLGALERLGARRADVSELLERGVETGHLDRPRAEAWGLLPTARTELAALVLRDQAEGALSRAVGAMDGPRDAATLLATAPLGLALATPPRVALAGSPNAGKSTLFNALVGGERALVTPEPGTTRDPVRETVSIEQVPVEFADTAGVEEARDALEGAAIERTWKALGGADLVLFVFDAEAGARGGELRLLERLAGRRALLVVNKIDVGSKKPLLEALPVSARTGEGLEELRRRILKALGVKPAYTPGAPVVFTRRQERLLRTAGASAKEDLLRGPA
jgi:tRNA modification GTPase